jgi:hypothetical protein
VFGRFQFHLLPLDQKFFFHAVRNDPIAGMSARCLLRSATMDWRTLGAAINPNDLQFSRGFFERLTNRQERL